MRVIRRWYLRPGRAVLELAHGVLDQIDQLGDAVGHRRIGGEAGGRRLAQLDAFAAGIGGVARLGDRDQLGQNLGLLLDARTAAEEDVDDLLEVEQPEGKLQGLRVDDMGQIAEAVGIFVVRIDQEDPEIGLLLEDLLEDERNRGGLADAGGAEHGEVLAQQLVEIDQGGDRSIEAQAADLDGVAAVDAMDDGDVLGHAGAGWYCRWSDRSTRHAGSWRPPCRSA